MLLSGELLMPQNFGMPQRRRRVFILAYFEKICLYEQVEADTAEDWLLKNGTLASTFLSLLKMHLCQSNLI